MTTTKYRLKPIKQLSISISKLHFQYVPKEFHKEFYKGSTKDMMKVENSPHYSFIKLYSEIGGKIFKEYNNTDYIKMMKKWGRDDKHNVWKMKRFIDTYTSIKRQGFYGQLSVLEEPLYEKLFEDGFEIYHGHHRSAICLLIGMMDVPCKIFRVCK